MKNVKITFLLGLPLILFSCSTDRQLITYEELAVNIERPQLNTEKEFQAEPEPKLPKVWRGRKLFSSPWAYIYAKDRISAEYAYDQLEDIADSKNPGSFGLVIVTGSKDNELAFDYKNLIRIYENLLTSGTVQEVEKNIFEEELKGLKKIKEFHDKILTKADEKKEENDLKLTRDSVERTFALATYFVQPEIMEKVLGTTIDNNIYWCAYLSVDDTIDEQLDGIVTSLLKDYDVSAFGKGLIWGIIAPGHYFRKRKVINKTQDFFEEGYKKNATQNKGVVTFSDKAVTDQLPATVKGSE